MLCYCFSLKQGRLIPQPPGTTVPSVSGTVEQRLNHEAGLLSSRDSLPSNCFNRPCFNRPGSCVQFSPRAWIAQSVERQTFNLRVRGQVPIQACCLLFYLWASLVAQTVKNLPAMQETPVRSLDWEDPLEKEMAMHCRILVWRIPWARGAWRAVSPRGHKALDTAG